jgi:hypothetical protein
MQKELKNILPRISEDFRRISKLNNLWEHNLEIHIELGHLSIRVWRRSGTEKNVARIPNQLMYALADYLKEPHELSVLRSDGKQWMERYEDADGVFVNIFIQQNRALRGPNRPELEAEKEMLEYKLATAIKDEEYETAARLKEWLETLEAKLNKLPEC